MFLTRSSSAYVRYDQVAEAREATQQVPLVYNTARTEHSENRYGAGSTVSPGRKVPCLDSLEVNRGGILHVPQFATD